MKMKVMMTVYLSFRDLDRAPLSALIDLGERWSSRTIECLKAPTAVKVTLDPFMTAPIHRAEYQSRNEVQPQIEALAQE